MSEPAVEQSTYFFTTLSQPVSISTDRVVFRVKPEFGEGTMTLYSLFPGYFASINQFTCREATLKNRDARHGGDRVLRFEYSLSSGYEFDDARSSHSIDAYQGACFSGVDRFRSVGFERRRCDSITMIVFLDQFLPFFESYWGDRGANIMACFACTDAADGFVMQQPKNHQPEPLAHMSHSIGSGDMVSARTRAIDLLHKNCLPYAACPCPQRTDRFVQHAARARAFIEQNVEADLTIDELARRQGVNASYLKTYFKRHYGTTIHSFKKGVRMERAAALLTTTDLTVKEIQYRVGYSDSGKFARSFRERFGSCPSQYRESSQSA